MLRTLSLSLLLLDIVQAVPNDLFRRATCNRDNCYRDVFGTAIATRPAQGTADCQSFLLSTVSPCTATVTASITMTSTVATVTTTSTSTSTSTTTFFNASPTVTVTATSTATATTTPTVTVSASTDTTTTVTSTETDYATVTAAALKRDLGAPNEKRQVACPTTIKPSTIPAYATDCASSSRFSSVCACNGITSSVTTLPAPTTTTTSTIVASVSATSTATVTSTSIVSTTVNTPTTITSTVTVTSTSAASPVTITLTSTNTVTATTTTTTTLTTTATPTPSTCAQVQPNYQAPNGSKYSVSCGYNYSGSSANIISGNSQPSFTACVNSCATTSGCTALVYYRDETTCYLLTDTRYGGYAQSSSDTAVMQ